MYFDGAFLLQGPGAGMLLLAPSREHLKYVIQMHFAREEATNNTAEYESGKEPLVLNGEASKQRLSDPVDGSICGRVEEAGGAL